MDQKLLDTLADQAFVETEVGAPQEVEAGFVTGEHLFDTQFSYEKNDFGQCCLFGLRIDTHQVPPAVKKAFRMMHEKALAADNPSGFASRNQKREALEAAEDQARQELASGRHRRSKMISVLWDLRRQTLYCGTSGAKALEILCRKMRQAFGVELSVVSSGSLAAALLEKQGLVQQFDTLQPSRFTDAPAAAHNDDPGEGGYSGGYETPPIPWLSRAMSDKDFLGNEFLLWLWWRTETGSGEIEIPGTNGERAVAVLVDRALDMDCAWGLTGRQSLRGTSVTRLPEAAEALRIGKWPRKLGLIVADGNDQCELTFGGDSLSVNGAKLPDIDDVSTNREFVEARLEQVIDLTELLDGLYGVFLAKRATDKWPTVLSEISQWIEAKHDNTGNTVP